MASVLKASNLRLQGRQRHIPGKFPAGSMVTTPHFHHRGHEFDPWSGNHVPTCHAVWQKNNTEFFLFKMYCKWSLHTKSLQSMRANVYKTKLVSKENPVMGTEVQKTGEITRGFLEESLRLGLRFLNRLRIRAPGPQSPFGSSHLGSHCTSLLSN